MRKIEVPTDSVSEFKLGDTVADIQQRRQEREAREREETQQQRKEEASRKKARLGETHSQEEGVAEKRPRTENSCTVAKAVGGEVQPS